MNTHRTIMSLWQIKITFLLLIMLSLGLWANTPANSLAQGGPAPTPTNVGAGGGNGNGGSGGGGGNQRERSEATPAPMGAGVSGFVYNYSTSTHEGGVSVVITGDGWETETISDSNGYYRFDGLGNGRGVINLRLPTGTHPVVVDWPIQTFEGAGLDVNLGYYWGDSPPMPVLLSADLASDVLTVQVENFTSENSTGGMIEVETSAALRISPNVEIIQGGATMAYDAHQSQLNVNDIPAGGKATIELTLAGATPAVGSNDIRVTFTYDQQYTPQTVIISAQSAASARMSLAEQSNADEAEKTTSQTSDSQPEATPEPASDTSLASTTHTAIDSTENAGPTPIPQLPVTGEETNTVPLGIGAIGILIFSTVMMVGLISAGWWSMKSSAKNRSTQSQPEPKVTSPYAELLKEIEAWDKNQRQKQ